MGKRLSEPWDVVVIGGGNAGLVSAMAARHHVRKILLLERAPFEFRGGNTRHTRNIRCVHTDSDSFSPGVYTYEELWSDLCGVGTGPSNEVLAELTVRESETIPRWMARHGIRWQRPLTGTLHLGRTNRFFLGGGTALVNSYHEMLRTMGIAVEYDATVEDFVIDDDRCTGIIVRQGTRTYEVGGRAFICASGGFEANIDWLRRYWGDAADNYVIRGPKTNDGNVLRALMDLGASQAGQERGFHAVAVDARAPRFDGGIATRIDAIPFGIVVNRHGERFYDEGEALWPKRYATWGRHIAEQPDQLAWCLWDTKVNDCFLPPMYPPSSAPTLKRLARYLNLDPAAVGHTIATYNAAVAAGGHFDPSKLDDCHTQGLLPPKSHWAQRLDTPPYFGLAMRTGITFTYMGLEVDALARVRRRDGSYFINVFAAGELMSGNILSTGYLAGFGLTIGSVWGRIAGTEAARVVR